MRGDGESMAERAVSVKWGTRKTLWGRTWRGRAGVVFRAGFGDARYEGGHVRHDSRRDAMVEKPFWRDVQFSVQPVQYAVVNGKRPQNFRISKRFKSREFEKRRNVNDPDIA